MGDQLEEEALGIATNTTFLKRCERKRLELKLKYLKTHLNHVLIEILTVKIT